MRATCSPSLGSTDHRRCQPRELPQPARATVLVSALGSGIKGPFSSTVGGFHSDPHPAGHRSSGLRPPLPAQLTLPIKLCQWRPAGPAGASPASVVRNAPARRLGGSMAVPTAMPQDPPLAVHLCHCPSSSRPSPLRSHIEMGAWPAWAWCVSSSHSPSSGAPFHWGAFQRGCWGDAMSGLPLGQHSHLQAWCLALCSCAHTIPRGRAERA